MKRMRRLFVRSGTHALAACQQSVPFMKIGIGVHADCRHLQLAQPGPLVKGLYVPEDMFELKGPRVYSTRGQAKEHERVVGVRRVSQSNQL